MTILATNTAGEYGVPGVGIFGPGETKPVSLEAAAHLARLDDFRLAFTDPNDLAFRDAEGRVRYVGFTGAVDTRFGYGGAGVTILRALSQLGVTASVRVYHNGRRFSVHTDDLPADARQQLVPRTFLPQVELMHSVPRDFGFGRSPVRVGWTMFETTRIPMGDIDLLGHWPNLINEHCDAVVVPCRQNKEVFEACGIRPPVTVIPYGLDTDVWPYFERPERDTFTVVQYGDLSSRKGPMEAIEAFQRAFSNEPNVRLVFKTQLGRFATGGYGLPEFRDKRISIIDATWNRAQLVQFLHLADCFIWLSRGEGFGLPPLQAALTGLPVVTTTHTGMAEYYRPNFFYGVRTAAMSPSPLGGEWYEPDVDHAAEQLRKVYDDRKAALKRGKAAATYTRNNFSLAAFAGRLAAYLEGL